MKEIERVQKAFLFQRMMKDSSYTIRLKRLEKSFGEEKAEGIFDENTMKQN